MPLDPPDRMTGDGSVLLAERSPYRRHAGAEGGGRADRPQCRTLPASDGWQGSRGGCFVCFFLRLDALPEQCLRRRPVLTPLSLLF